LRNPQTLNLCSATYVANDFPGAAHSVFVGAPAAKVRALPN